MLTACPDNAPTGTTLRIARGAQSFDLLGAAADVHLLAAARQFLQWLDRLDPRFRIHCVTLQALDRRADGGLLFAKFIAEVTDNLGRPVPGAVFLRGDAVAVLIVLHVAGRAWVVLTAQPRFPSGVFASIEIPAGMMDDHGDMRGKAVQEVQEETGLALDAHAFVPLGEFFPSGGGSDELIRLYLCEHTVTPAELAAMHGRCAGAAHEHEHIRVLVVPLDELPRHTSDIKALLAYGAYRGLWGSPTQP
jgi:ADP-sugar diphosphatase